jgi:hypothetical protein
VVILKIFFVSDYTDPFFDRLEFTRTQNAILDLMKLLYLILILAHFTACLWYIIGAAGDPKEDNWISALGIQDDDWFT